MNNRVARCVMFVTPTNPRFIDKAWTRGGDCYILDIEDSIAPAEKERCRTLIKESIAKANKGGASIFVRINKPFVDADLPYAVWPGVDRIMLPKTETAEEVRHADAIITRLEKERGIAPGTIELYPMIESCLGAVNIHEILTATSRKIYSMGGAGGYDMAVSLGIEMFADFDQYAFPMAYLHLAAMTEGIETIGAVFVPNPSGRVDQGDQAEKQAAALRACWIHQAGALHPNFIEPLVKGLTPTADEVVWANRVVETYGRLVEDGESVGEFEGKAIDKYEYALAQRTLDWNAQCVQKDAHKARAMARAKAAEKTSA